MDHRKNSKKGGWWPFGSDKAASPVTTGTPTTPASTPEDEVDKCIKKCREPKKSFMEGIFGKKTTAPAAAQPAVNAPPANPPAQAGGKKRRSKGSKMTRKHKKRKGTRRCSRK